MWLSCSDCHGSTEAAMRLGRNATAIAPTGSRRHSTEAAMRAPSQRCNASAMQPSAMAAPRSQCECHAAGRNANVLQRLPWQHHVGYCVSLIALPSKRWLLCVAQWVPRPPAQSVALPARRSCTHVRYCVSLRSQPCQKRQDLRRTPPQPARPEGPSDTPQGRPSPAGPYPDEASGRGATGPYRATGGQQTTGAGMAPAGQAARELA